MGMIAIFSTIGFVICLGVVIFYGHRVTKIRCAIGALVFAVIATAGFFMEGYYGNNPKIIVETYKTFSIDPYAYTVIRFEKPVLVTKTITKYGASIFHNATTLYEVAPLEE